MEKGRKKFLNDIILVLVLLISALSVFIIWRVTREEGTYAVVYIDGVKSNDYPLSASGEYPLNGGTNILVISDGKAYMKEADCPQQRCVRTGVVSLSGESIICLHNRVEVRIEGGEEVVID